MSLVYYLPLCTFTLSLIFAGNLYLHLREKKKGSAYLVWWMIGILTYGAGTLCESLNTLTGWHEFNFRCWFVTGALLGGAPLAQGTVYLLLPKKPANVLSIILVALITVSSVLVFLSPVNYTLINPQKMAGNVLNWLPYIILPLIIINVYAVIFLAGGAVYSAIKYFRKQGGVARFRGNVLIAIGAILPAIGGTYTHYGQVEVLYITELIGLILIFIAYRIMRSDKGVSVHTVQQPAEAV